MKEQLINAYSKLAKDYELNVDTSSGHNAYYERPAMISLLPATMDQLDVLDAGCAAGWYTEYCLGQGAKVTAIDLSPAMIEACRRRVGERANVLAGDLSEPLPFAAESFDLIISSLTLHYIEDWTKVFRELHRVMKPGASLIFSVHHPFMDFRHFERPDYFAHELLIDVWNKPAAGRVEVPFYRRPLQEILNAAAAHFVIEHVAEPKPVLGDLSDEQYARWHEKWYDRLLTNPHFLILKVRKV